MTEHLHVHTPGNEDPPGVGWQLRELHKITVEGFAKIDGKIEGVEREQKELATRVTKVEVKQDIAERRSLDPTKILLAVIALAAAAIGGGAVSPFG